MRRDETSNYPGFGDVHTNFLLNKRFDTQLFEQITLNYSPNSSICSKVKIVIKAESSTRSSWIKKWAESVGSLMVGGTLVYFALQTSRYGFNPTDDGFILAQSKRILDGNLPHLDFLSPRPVGSPLIHTLSMIVPVAQLYVSRLLVFFEFWLISLVLVSLCLEDRREAYRRQARLAVTVVVFVLNIHIFPLMPWHTIDGILLSLVGAHLLLRTSRYGAATSAYLGSIALGFAAVTKQSFFPVVAIGCWLVITNQGLAARQKIAAVALSVLPGMLYISWVSMAGGLSSALEQLLGGPGPKLSWIANALSPSVLIIGSMALLLGVIVPATFRKAFPDVGEETQALVSRTGDILLLLYATTLLATREQDFSDWSSPWLALGAVSCCLRGYRDRKIPAPQVFILLLAVMTSLSWGYPAPNLISGGLFLILLSPLLGMATNPLRIERVPRVLASLSIAVLPAMSSALILEQSDLRQRVIYRDLDLSASSVSLSSIDSDLKFIRSNPRIHQLLNDIKDCKARYPSPYFAVLPDFSSAALIFGGESPFKIDWWSPYEVFVSNESYFQVVEAASSYLVLFQTFDMATVAGNVPLPSANEIGSLPPNTIQQVRELLSGLEGEPVSCGVFVGKYLPPAPTR